MPVTFDEFKEEIITSLGGTLVDVELSKTDIEVCFRKAKRTFKQKGHNTYNPVLVAFDIVKGQLSYPMPEKTTSVIKIIRPRLGGFSTEDAFSMAAYQNLFNVGAKMAGGFDFLTYELTMQQREMFRKYAAEELDFDFNQFTHTMTLRGTPKREGRYFAETYQDMDDAHYYEVDWIVNWTIAEAMNILGIAYRKFQNLASPDGSTGMSGSEYIQQAEEMKRKLLEDIDNMVDGNIDVMGIYVG
jgi:hypothetical protein